MTSGAVAVESLEVWRGTRRTLGPLDLTIPVGARVIVAGPNGCGKTTLLQALLGLLPHGGSVRVLGEVVGTRSWRQTRRRVAYVSQEAVQPDFPISAWEVAEIGVAASAERAAVRRRKVETALRATDAWALRRRLYAELSGGEKQRVSLARCLSQDAELLLMDEPAASLDPDGRAELLALLAGLAPELTVVMVTHEESHLEDRRWRVLRLEQGLLLGDAG